MYRVIQREERAGHISSKSKGKDKIAPVHHMKSCRETMLQLHSYLTSALDGYVWLTSSLGRFTFGNESWYPFSKGQVGP